MSDNKQFRLLYQQEQLPIFQNRMYESEAEAKDCPKGDVRLVEDPQSGLIYNAAFRPELMTYDVHYQNEQGVSLRFQAHLGSVSQIVERCLGRDSIVEVGCGKGLFLELLIAKGFDVTGFDPVYEGNNPRVRRCYFRPGDGKKAAGLVLRHVLEHIQDPFNFLLQLKDANGGSGKIYIEVPRFDWICENRAWFDIFYEHVNYFRISDFHRMFGTVYESGILFGGQYFYVVAELATLQRPKRDPNDSATFPADFTQGITTLDNIEHRPVAIWGGASKGVIFALLKARAGQRIDLVIDINPAKQGKYLPATGIKVRSPTEILPVLPEEAVIYVMNSNYLDEVRAMSGNTYRYVAVDHG